MSTGVFTSSITLTMMNAGNVLRLFELRIIGGKLGEYCHLPYAALHIL